MNRGREIPSEFIDYKLHFDSWGFNDSIILLNQEKPDSVKCIIEPQKAESVILSWRYNLVFEEIYKQDLNSQLIPAMLKEYIEYLYEFDFIRDKFILELVKKLSRDPRNCIAIPRGYAHCGMATFLMMKNLMLL